MPLRLIETLCPDSAPSKIPQKRGQIVTVEGAKHALNQDRGKTTLHRVAVGVYLGVS